MLKRELIVGIFQSNLKIFKEKPIQEISTQVIYLRFLCEERDSLLETVFILHIPWKSLK